MSANPFRLDGAWTITSLLRGSKCTWTYWCSLLNQTVQINPTTTKTLQTSLYRCHLSFSSLAWYRFSSQTSDLDPPPGVPEDVSWTGWMAGYVRLLGRLVHNLVARVGEDLADCVAFCRRGLVYKMRSFRTRYDDVGPGGVQDFQLLPEQLALLGGWRSL